MERLPPTKRRWKNYILNSTIHVAFLFLLLTVSDSRASPGPPAASFDDIQIPDYTVGESESNKPDEVDNEVIQSLVDKFLNKGTLESDERKPNEKLNLQAVRLINSSTYWSTENLVADGSISNQETIRTWLSGYSEELRTVMHQVALAGWNYFASASLTTKQFLDEAEEVARLFIKSSTAQSRQFNISTFKQGTIERVQLSLLMQQGMNALNDIDLSAYNKHLLSVNQFFSTVTICSTPSPTGTIPGNLPPQHQARQQQRPQNGLEGIASGGNSQPNGCILRFGDLPAALLQPTSDATETFNLWQNWRLATGANLTQHYAALAELTNKGARLNGFTDTGEMWRSVFDLSPQSGWIDGQQQQQTFNILAQMDNVYEQIRPFYEQLHAYFRPRVASFYRSRRGSASISSTVESGVDEMAHANAMAASVVTRDGPIPVHLLKSMNGDSWVALYEETRPFADDAALLQSSPSTSASAGNGRTQMGGTMPVRIADEVLEQFRHQNFTVRTIFARVQRFMKYLGFDDLPKSFWTDSIFTRNWSKDMICNPATPYDMVDGYDYRMKYCGQLSEQDFVQAHKLLSKFHYMYGSRQQPILLRDAPNPSLSSALAGAFGVIALNPKYLHSQKLIGPKTERVDSTEINRLYKEALEDVVALPFALVADKWRYALFEGRIHVESDGNTGSWADHWWALRTKYQGLSAPVGAALAATFDAVASPGIAQQHSPSARNFLAYVAQFQVLEHICGPHVSITQGCVPTPSTMAPILDAVRHGGSISWLDAFERLTGSRELDAGPMLRYFGPLIHWLRQTNEQENRIIGWIDEPAKGKPFSESEIPDLRTGEWESEHAFGNADESNIAYPGQNCANGQECLLDSQCNGTICACRPGMYTLIIADTYNCVPGNPADVGFANGNGGLVITLTPNNTTEPSKPMNKTGDDVDTVVEVTTKPAAGNSAASHFVKPFTPFGLFILSTAVLVAFVNGVNRNQ